MAQKRSLGQVFLRTDWPARKVASIMRSHGVRSALEIGPGPGILTFCLLDEGFEVTAVEKDERFAEQLRDHATHRGYGDRVAVESADFLRYDLEKWLNPAVPQAIVGNIPYNISTPILMRTLPHLAQLAHATFLVQLEFGRRVSAHHGSKDYGSLSVFTQLRAQVTFESTVERTCFRPVPKVDSCLVTLRPRRDRPDARTLERVEVIAREAFTQRRKKLRNSIKRFLTDPTLENASPIDLTRRAETLSPGEFVQLARHLFPDDAS